MTIASKSKTQKIKDADQLEIKNEIKEAVDV